MLRSRGRRNLKRPAAKSCNGNSSLAGRGEPARGANLQTPPPPAFARSRRSHPPMQSLASRFRLDTPARPFTIDEYLCMIMDKYASTEKAAYAMVRREERRTPESLMAGKLKDGDSRGDRIFRSRTGAHSRATSANRRAVALTAQCGEKEPARHCRDANRQRAAATDMLRSIHFRGRRSSSREWNCSSWRRRIGFARTGSGGGRWRGACVSSI